MTVAGSDSSGSSGVQADLPTFAALGAHGTTVVTIVTAQNSLAVDAFHPLPDVLITRQLESLLRDLPPAATKTGLLLRLDTALLIEAHAGRLGRLVIDPVLVDSRGSVIVEPGVVDVYRRLCAGATVLTPNRAELELLLHTDTPLESVEAVEAQAGAIRALGAQLVVVTGGRGAGPDVVDVVVSRTEVTRLRGARVAQGPIRGTGCTFSAALAACLAHGESPERAARRAHDFVQAQLRLQNGLQIGAGFPGVPHRFVGSEDARESE